VKIVTRTGIQVEGIKRPGYRGPALEKDG